ncbi:uncharacterized protein [Lepeophtheirus salmonis]|uniref:uncharacterized protein n=1 Tax=Lepeophtheirus salmonis TaxID=72036 RepID=UPI001AE54960|nr:poly [ADP-ribose] polymerase tankyrase-1-like isoform X2 [Lepeophtheirus salmonis]
MAINVQYKDLGSTISTLELHRAIQDGKKDIVEDLILHKRVSLEIKNDYGLSPLHVACTVKDFETIKLLLKMGVDINGRSSHEKTPLHLTAFSGDVQIFNYLIKFGANIKAQDSQGVNVLHEAVLGGGLEVIDYIMKHKPNLTKKQDKHGQSPIHLAAFINLEQDGIKLLLKTDQDLHLEDINGHTPLQMSEIYSDWSNIDLSLKKTNMFGK